MKVRSVSKEDLVEMYWGKQLNQRQMAEILGVNLFTVWQHMKKFQIPVRGHDALVLSYKDSGRKKNTWSRGRNVSDETRKKLSLSHKGQIGWRTGNPWSEEDKLRLSLAHKGQVSHYKGVPMSEEQKEYQRKIAKEYWDNPENNERREECRRRGQRLWKDPKYVIKQIQARGVKPNKPEKRLDNIVSKEFPEFKYNGDGRLGIVLAGLVPDFVNVNGRKQVIEVFGLYWHQIKEPKWHQTELGRIMAYNSIGWDCLIIWENELKDVDTVIIKIKEFCKE